MAYDYGAGFGSVIEGVIRDTGLLWNWSRARSARRQAQAAQERAEVEARLEARRQMEFVERQMSRGRAGDASEAQAQEALRGRSGRANKLDEWWF